MSFPNSTCLNELVLDQTDLPLEESKVWTDATPSAPCTALNTLGSVCLILTEQLNELEPDQHNRVYLRVPIEVENG
jgi:hypothetical protein